MKIIIISGVLLGILLMAGVGLGAAGDKTVNTYEITVPAQVVDGVGEFVKSSPTYSFDGVDGSISVYPSSVLKCSGCWEFVAVFQSANAGYGDRST